MTKATITKIWIAGLIVLAVGLVVGGVCLGLMLAFGGHFVAAASGNGYDFVPNFDGFFWTMVGFMVLGFTVAAVGGVLQFAAWIGALINTYRLPEKTWFIVLLAGGLLGLGFGLAGFAVMVAYLIAGPDGMAIRQPEMPMMPTTWPPVATAAQPAPAPTPPVPVPMS